MMSPALQAALARVVPSYMQAVSGERERQVVMAVLEALTGVLRACGPLALQPPGRLAELCGVLKAVLQRKVRGAGGLRGEEGAGPSREGRGLQARLPPPPRRGEKGPESPGPAELSSRRQPVRTLTRRRRRKNR